MRTMPTRGCWPRRCRIWTDVSIDLDAVETNIVIFRLTGALSAQDVVARLKARGILASTVGPDAIRLVTHLDVDRGACVVAAQALIEEIEAA